MLLAKFYFNRFARSNFQHILFFSITPTTQAIRRLIGSYTWSLTFATQFDDSIKLFSFNGHHREPALLNKRHILKKRIFFDHF